MPVGELTFSQKISKAHVKRFKKINFKATNTKYIDLKILMKSSLSQSFRSIFMTGIE